MHIRPETPADWKTIYRLTKTAFAPMPFSQGDEAECLARLRNDGDLTLSLVATEGHRIVGHVAFSPVLFNDAFRGWYGLGPISVWPDLQRRGIGRALILRGLEELKRKDALGCVLIGDPNYYGQFGFIGNGRLSYRDLPSEIVQWVAFGETMPAGVIKFSPGLETAAI